jgi:hypothetical protein
VPAFADFNPATPTVTVSIAARKNLLVTFMGHSHYYCNALFNFCEFFGGLLKLYFLDNRGPAITTFDSTQPPTTASESRTRIDPHRTPTPRAAIHTNKNPGTSARIYALERRVAKIEWKRDGVTLCHIRHSQYRVLACRIRIELTRQSRYKDVEKYSSNVYRSDSP